MIIRIRCDNEKLKEYIYVLAILVSFFFPTSRKAEVMDYRLINISYLFLMIVLALFSMMEISQREIRKTTVYLNFAIISFMVCFTMITAFRYVGLTIDNGTIVKCLLLLLTVNYTYDHEFDKKTITFALLIVSLAIIVLGICMIIGVDKTNLFLKKYYTDHVGFFYNIMMRKHKPVTFFVTHSISAYVYFLLYFCWETQSFFNKAVSFVMKMMLLVLLVFLKSTSSILCLGIIAYYMFVMKKVKNAFDALIKILMIFCFCVALTFVWNDVTSVLFSTKHGFGGRYTHNGGIVADLNYVLDGGIPSGLLTLDNLSYTDSGYLVNMLRGGIIYTVAVYFLFCFRLRNAMGNNWVMQMFFWGTMLFEFGYPILMNQRYVSALLLSVYCIKANSQSHEISCDVEAPQLKE